MVKGATEDERRPGYRRVVCRRHTGWPKECHNILSSHLAFGAGIFFNFSTPCIENVNNTGTKYGRIMKQTAFLKGKKESIYHLEGVIPLCGKIIYCNSSTKTKTVKHETVKQYVQ